MVAEDMQTENPTMIWALVSKYKTTIANYIASLAIERIASTASLKPATALNSSAP